MTNRCNLNMEQIQVMKKELQQEIMDLVNGFEKETGLFVDNISLSNSTDMKGHTETYSVELSIHL